MRGSWTAWRISAWTPTNFDYRPPGGADWAAATAAWWPAHAGDQSLDARTITGDIASVLPLSVGRVLLVCRQRPSSYWFSCLSDAIPIRVFSHLAEPDHYATRQLLYGDFSTRATSIKLVNSNVADKSLWLSCVVVKLFHHAVTATEIYSWEK